MKYLFALGVESEKEREKRAITYNTTCTYGKPISTDSLVFSVPAELVSFFCLHHMHGNDLHLVCRQLRPEKGTKQSYLFGACPCPCP
jgi:hypothetical protein